ncbi:hypothetical protein PIB30_009581 [Stylosanthes scabra]|uniref:Uncharacterized protein n=1 Tax=Stylosanthes scabra TaxID=79078 RepID=A0ABU6R6E3_9FABA|nr:hypothetical protein [Stylosanthes scabra]
MGRPKKSDAKHTEKAKHNEEDASSSKNQGHLFRSLTTTVATMFEYLNKNPDKLRLVNELGFGALSHLPTNNLDQQLLKEIYDRYDVRDNTIYSDAAAVKITTRKNRGCPWVVFKRVVRKKLSQEDKDIHKFFEGNSAVALTELVQTTPLDTEENRKLFMRAFILFIQKALLLRNSTSSIVPNALTTIFDLETTRKRNWALHVHDFLLQELKKAKQNNAAAIHGCVYVLMIIYFHETQFEENSKEVEARRPWIAYWKGDTLKQRLKQERTHEAGLLKTRQMMAKKSVSKRKSPPMRVPPSNRDFESESESYQPSADSEATESNLAADTKPEPDPEPVPEAEQITQLEIKSKWKNDHTVVASNAPVHTTQQSVAGPGSLSADDDRLVDFIKRNKRRKSQRIANTHKKQKLDQINEGDGATRSPSETRMFDTFDIVNLGRDDSDHIVVEGPVVAPTQPSQPEKEALKHEDVPPTVDDNINEAGVEDKNAGVDVPPTVEEVVLEEAQPKALAVILPVQPEQPSKSEVEAPLIVVEEEKEPEQQSEVEPDPINIENPVHPEGQSGMATEDVTEHTELDPEPINIQTPLEPELTLKPWLNPEAETTAAKGTTISAEEIITNVLLSMKKEDKGEEGNQNQQPGDQEQCNTPNAAPASMEERCFIWATTEIITNMTQSSNYKGRIL